MRPYAQYCPIVRAVEALGDRWTLLIVREMLTGATRFNEFSRGLPGLSRALLSRRLRQLENAGIVTHTDSAYALTQAGEDLRPLVFGLADWGARHAFGDPKPEELDPEVLMWWLHGRVDTSELTKRAVIQIEVADRSRVFWLVLEPGDASVCYTDPGFDIDAVLASDIATLFRVWEGEIDLTAAAKTGALTLTGARWIVRGFPTWLQLSPAAPYVQAAQLAKAGGG
ncbi:DNA-binding transcriptional regulator, HxlR family [Actinokineospora alba]|uniref:DNA-binding transcriptional regulator, HxlR family n=1 Tax=Actinokineospora alba TaxID=504798 RepID=A0A1H0VIG2_9PSEU|nr:helix-turn-helix domain-containing protein [Actinokineospora alba]TDP67706.1 HxlR family transcriptional regulator [Actinokineospora alba]SDJ27846.1 DNA-binding transcriptional regulator, HxlR family [Actinokineospora alba]SDP78114.1 DNA-binding transcriptional regulator, HxlR family [Actinokineospora alba]